MKLVQINSCCNTGSTGHIAEGIGELAIEDGFSSYIAYGFDGLTSHSEEIKISNKLDQKLHIYLSVIFGLHGLGSVFCTLKFIKKLNKIHPSIVHLHNIHGYYINYPILFKWLKKKNVPVVWTFHDCWNYTGHCAYYSFNKCNKWTQDCLKCNYKRNYPAVRFFTNSKLNFKLKKKYFTSLDLLHIVVPSYWLKENVKKSFFNKYDISVIPSGIDLSVFYPRIYSDEKIILGVAGCWDVRKGLSDFIELSKIIDNEYKIVLIGLSESQIKTLPDGIVGISKTESKEQLAEWYSRALVYFNASVEETQGLTTVEALACGTPCIVYNATAVPESINDDTGFVVEAGDVKQVYENIKIINKIGKRNYLTDCVNRAKKNYDSKKKLEKYIDIYDVIMDR